MPVLELFVSPPNIPTLPASGNLDLSPAVPGLGRVPIRRLVCSLRVPPIPGAREAILDTGAPLSIFPHRVLSGDYNWKAGRDYDELSVAGGAPTGQVLGFHYSFRLVRLRVPVVLSGKNLKGDRLRIDSLVCQLAKAGGPTFILLGLWGGVFDNRRLVIDRDPAGDELTARLEF